MPLYTDARHYAEKGIPIVLYGAGPHTIQEANAHRADERLPLADLHKATEVVALTLLDLLARSLTGAGSVIRAGSTIPVRIREQRGAYGTAAGQ